MSDIEIPNWTPTIEQSGTFQVLETRPAWAWRCEICGWLGVGHSSENAALREASDHYWVGHAVALCADVDGVKQLGHPGHRWEHVPRSDSTDKCARCGTTCAK